MNKNIKITFLGGVLSAGLTFMLNVVAARFMPLEEFSQFAVYLNVSLIVISVLELGLPISLILINNKNGIDDAKSVAAFVIRLIAILTVSFVLILYFIRLDYTLISIVSYSAIVSVYKLCNTFNQIENKWMWYSLNNIIYNSVKLLFVFFICFSSACGVFVLFSGLIIATAICLLILSRTISSNIFTIRSELWILKRNTHTIISMVFINVITAILMRVDIILIDFYKIDAGSYFVANNLCMIIPLLSSAIGSVKIRYHEGRIASFTKVILFSLFIFFFYVVFGNVGIKYIYGGRFPAANELLYIIAFTYSIGLAFVQYESDLYNKSLKKLLILKSVQLFVMIVSGMFLIEHFSAVGMAFALLLSRLCGWIYLYNYKVKLW